MMNANEAWALASELTANRPSAPANADSIVYSPALPQAAISDEAASSAKKAGDVNAPAAASNAIRLRHPARSRQWASTSARAHALGAHAGRPQRQGTEDPRQRVSGDRQPDEQSE